MRYLGWADAVGRELVQRYPNVLFESLLLVSLTLLKAEGEAAAAVPGMPVYAPHTVVDQAVTAASGPRPGCVQRVAQRLPAPLPARTRGASGGRGRQPRGPVEPPGWWVKQLRVAYPQHWQAILQAANLPAR